MVSAGTGSPCLLALPPSQPWFFPIKLVAGIQREAQEHRKDRHTSPLITGEVGADGARKVGLRLVWNDYSWG